MRGMTVAPARRDTVTVAGTEQEIGEESDRFSQRGNNKISCKKFAILICQHPGTAKIGYFRVNIIMISKIPMIRCMYLPLKPFYKGFSLSMVTA